MIKSIPVAALFVYIGFTAKDTILLYIYNNKAKRYVCYLLPLFVLLALLNKTVNIARPEYNDFFIYMFCALYGSFMILVFSTVKSSSFIEYIGSNSLLMFSLHAIWIFFFTEILNKILGTNYVPKIDMPYYYVLIGGAIIIVMTALSTMLVLPIYNKVLEVLKLK